MVNTNSEHALILIKNRKPCLCVRLLPILIKSDEYSRMKRFTSKYDKALESRGNEVNKRLSSKNCTFYDQLPLQTFGEKNQIGIESSERAAQVNSFIIWIFWGILPFIWDRNCILVLSLFGNSRCVLKANYIIIKTECKLSKMIC